jgi:Fe-S-cluster-containing hydrogenase component 2
MEEFDIQLFSEKCAGCLRCQLACSDLFSKTFDPSISRIQVVFSDADCVITLTEECNRCGVCVEHCFYDAITKNRREAER